MNKTIRFAALAAAVVAGGAVVILQTVGSDASTVKPASVPAASAFAAGACRDSASAVQKLAVVTAKSDGAKKLSQSVRNQLVTEGNKLVKAKPAASGEPLAKITDLLASIGYVRINTGATYNAELLRSVESARAALQSTCTS